MTLPKINLDHPPYLPLLSQKSHKTYPNWVVRDLGVAAYEPCYQAMQAFTKARQADTPDELWVLEHLSVYTLGQAGLSSHLLRQNDIPCVMIDRGGQITYHGLGQLVVYLLLDLRRLGFYVKALVCKIEQAIIDTLAKYDIQAYREVGAPGVYVNQPPHSKIAALGLKVSRGCTYHGLALNVAMDLNPWQAINPCGYEGLTVTDMQTYLQTRHDLMATDALGLTIQTVKHHLIQSLEKEIFGV